MKYGVFLVFSVGFQLLCAQSFKEFVEADVSFVQRVDLSKLEDNSLSIAMPFDDALILNPEQKSILEECVTLKLSLVYTEYRTSSSFNQKELNRKRLGELKKLVPSLFENPLWSYELVSQTNCNSREACDTLFHGFIITYRPNSDTVMLSKEVAYLEDVAVLLTDTSELDTIRKIHRIKTRWDDRVGFVHDTIWRNQKKEKKLDPPDFFYQQSLYQDSTILKVLERNRGWMNNGIVTDVTGSMSPYIAQVFVWLKRQSESENTKYFTFFNDGDDKASIRKKPLSTRGIYTVENKKFTTVVQEATKAMRKGSGGGERLENDVEAIIETLDIYKDVEHIILIADNYESMRDYVFLEKIKVPVHVILCGAESRINIQYLDLARKTGGSVHTKESDVTNLGTYKNRTTFSIEGKKYRYENGRFHFIYD